MALNRMFCKKAYPVETMDEKSSSLKDRPDLVR